MKLKLFGRAQQQIPNTSSGDNPAWLLRADEAEEMAMMEDCGILQGSPEWERHLAAYRASLRWHWITLGLDVRDLAKLTEAVLMRNNR